jgi:hypothetical protein
MRSIGGIRSLLTLNNPDCQPAIDALWKKIEEQIAGIPETDGDVILTEDPWAFQPKAGTCFGGMFIIDERIAENVYKGHQVIWRDEHGGITKQKTGPTGVVMRAPDPVSFASLWKFWSKP